MHRCTQLTYKNQAQAVFLSLEIPYVHRGQQVK
jgi:hypothetical protein